MNINSLTNTAPKISPYCTHDIVTRVGRVKNLGERKCFCPLANNSEWLNPCNRPGVCTNQEVNAAYGELFRMKKDVCTFSIPTAFTRPQAPAPAPAPAPGPAPASAPAPVPAPAPVAPPTTPRPLNANASNAPGPVAPIPIVPMAPGSNIPLAPSTTTASSSAVTPTPSNSAATPLREAPSKVVAGVALVLIGVSAILVF